MALAFGWSERVEDWEVVCPFDSGDSPAVGSVLGCVFFPVCELLLWVGSSRYIGVGVIVAGLVLVGLHVEDMDVFHFFDLWVASCDGIQTSVLSIVLFVNGT